jgi:4-amino-4-deoxy-L-arabinose transferase-like glycosyltransferase
MLSRIARRVTRKIEALKISRLLWLLLLIAAGARIALYTFWPNVASPDSAVYIASGNSLFSSGQMSTTVYMPLYPILIHLAGYDGVIWIQIALSVATILLAYWLAITIWKDKGAGLIAALFCAIHPILMYYAIDRLTETLTAFLLILGLVLLYRRQILLASIVLVLLDLTRPTFDYVLPLLVIAATFATESPPRFVTITRRLAIFVATYVVLMSPWWFHNYKMYGQFVRLDLADGVTSILENSGSYERHGLDWSVEQPWAPFGGIVDPVSQNDAMRRAAISYIWNNPTRWLQTSLDRLRRFFTPWPSGLTERTTQRVSEGAIEAITAAVTVPFLGAALVSLLFLRRRWRLMLPLLIPIAFLTAVHAATHALMRYRIPIDPLLIVLASGPLVLMMRSLTSRLRIVGTDDAAKSPGGCTAA